MTTTRDITQKLYLDSLTKYGFSASKALNSFLFRSFEPIAINKGFLEYVDPKEVQTEPNIIFVNKEDAEKLKSFHGEVMCKGIFALDGVEHELFIYNIASSNNCIWTPVYLGVVYHDGCFNFNNYLDNYLFLFRNSLLHSKTFIELAKDIKCSTTRYQCLRIAGYQPEGNFYSEITHKFENIVALKYDTNAEYKIFAPCNNNYNLNLGLNKSDFILPLGAYVRIRQRKHNLVENHSVYEQGILHWSGDGTKVTNGLTFKPDDFLDSSVFDSMGITLEQTFNNLVKDLLVSAGVSEGDFRDNVHVVHGEERDIETAFFNTDKDDWHCKELVGRLAAVKEGEDYFISPLLQPTAANTILVYKLTSGTTNYLVCPSYMKQSQVINMFKDYFKLLDFDLNVKIGATAGGGYCYSSFNLINNGYYRFNDSHVEDGIIVVKELTP